MSSGYSAFGTTFTWDSETIAELSTISGPNQTVETIDMTNHSSSNQFREFIAGLRDGGEVTIEGNFIPSDTDGQIALVTDMQAGSTKTAVITGPTSAAYTWTFSAICTSIEMTQPFDGKIGFTATFKITGKPVLAVTASTNPSGLVITGNVGGPATLMPAFAAAERLYITDDCVADASVTVTVTAASAETITVNGSAVTSGVPSSAISLTADDITTITVVITDSGKMPITIVVYVYDGSA